MEWLDGLKKVAPTVVSLLSGSTFAGIAVEALGSALGIGEPTVDKVKKVIEGGNLNSDQLVAIKLAEQQVVVRLEELGVKREELELADNKSARDMQIATQSMIPGALAFVVTFGFFGILIGMLLNNITPSEPLLVMLGSLGTSWTAVVGFYFGSSHGSRVTQQVIAAQAAT